MGPRPGEEEGNFGLPCYPVLVMLADAVMPPSGEVVEATRNLWSSAVQPFLLDATQWVETTSQMPVNTEEREVEFPWPRIAPAIPEGGGDGKFLSDNGCCFGCWMLIGLCKDSECGFACVQEGNLH